MDRVCRVHCVLNVALGTAHDAPRRAHARESESSDVLVWRLLLRKKKEQAFRERGETARRVT
jgi:hypothetical protein